MKIITALIRKSSQKMSGIRTEKWKKKKKIITRICEMHSVQAKLPKNNDNL